MTMDWQGAPASPSSYAVKRILRLDIPVDSYPNVSSMYNASFLHNKTDLFILLTLKLLWFSSILLDDFWALEVIH